MHGSRVSPRCPVCVYGRETTWHALWGCKKLKPVRESMLVAQQIGSDIDMCDVVLWSEAFVTDYKKANEVARQSGSQIPKNVVWQPPCIGRYKLNTDAAIDYDGKIMGFGAVIRDSVWMVIATSSQRIEATYPPHVAEAIAMYRGLLLATDIGVFSVEAEFDAATVVKWVVDGDLKNSDVGLILADIRSLMYNFNFCSIGFVPRKANYVAHHLANMVFCLSEDCLWTEDYPSCVRGYLLKDHPGYL
ncbi:hypothetical protein Ddye_018415 [Dipteronia dyeriana]|uniref:RNase H type-1 domain-containing protein n=1 Tax=Dipteronia dyeriana TaxID=168575 RepID=A0AAD9X1F4_9ROSI|nr:hypothetical protein Ddye_018415 [Dipteronia dyeriana]